MAYLRNTPASKHMSNSSCLIKHSCDTWSDLSWLTIILVTILNFQDNNLKIVYGGGLYVKILDNSRNNSLVLIDGNI